jgi:hypothetical protein
MSHRAEVQYYSHDFRAAVATCRDILQRDPYHLTCLPVYLCTLHELQQKNELFYRELRTPPWPECRIAFRNPTISLSMNWVRLPEFLELD